MQGREMVGSLQRRVHTAMDMARGRAGKRVACVQWTEPLYAAGAWIPELIALAGGSDVLCKKGGPSEPFLGAFARKPSNP